jgi:hypothetical protein
MGGSMSDYTVTHLDDIDEVDDGRCPFRPVRHHLQITSFGANAFTARSAGDRIINEHDEVDEDEELYLVHTGRARFELGGESVDAPAGTLVFAQPGVKRTAFAEEPGTTVLALGGRSGKAYEVGGWEIWAPLHRFYEAGDYDTASDRGRVLIAKHPEYPDVAYNVACCESLAGRKADAIEHLRVALASSEQLRSFAAKDSDLDPLRDEPAFKELLA